MKFLADMGISPNIVGFLEQLRHGALHLQQQGLHRLKDWQILEKVRKEGYILLTHTANVDFAAD